MAKKTLIDCGCLITMDRGIGTLRDAHALVEGDRIVTPGLVNAHVHLWQVGLRGVGSEWMNAESGYRVAAAE
jgi:cytosine/adenosine deaminase-related metal-dependent hydrolase